jgi:hypothetical protein
MNYNDILIALKNKKFTDDEYNEIINICKQKQEEMTDNYYSNKIYEMNNNFINQLKMFHFYKKTSETLISLNIKFSYDIFIIILSNRKSYCADFGGVSIENYIHIIDTNNENCYNLFGDNMILKFKNIINLDMSEDEIKNMLNNIFSIYQPDELIKF